MNILNRKISGGLLLTLVITAIFVVRVIFFASSFGGVEHDSGWYLGVARNLAQRGIYASYTNTIIEEGIGVHPSIHGRFSVQDNNSFSYFPAGVSVGSGYIMPEALIIKIFGGGWWQYRLWPLITYAGLLLILFTIALRIGRILGLSIFVVWLWVIPQLTMTFAYEALSEHIALFYLMISFLFCYSASHKEKGYFLMFFSGLFLSFSILTKTLFLLTGVSFLLSFLFEIIAYKNKLKLFFSRWFLFLCGLAIPIMSFEFYRYFYLTSHFGIEGWNAINKDIKLLFQSAGSGISNLNLANFDYAFILKKLAIWQDVGISQALIPWTIFLLSPILILRKNKYQNTLLILLLYASAVLSFIWFIIISPTGLARHIWHGIIVGMLLISITLGKIANRVLLLGFLMTIIIVSVKYEILDGKPFFDYKIISKWNDNRYIRGLQGFPTNPILSLNDQKGIVSFFDKQIRNIDRVYYAGWFLNAEVSPLVDKVFYTLDRYFILDQKNPDGGQSYLIFGPYQQGIWSLMPPEYLPRKIGQFCQEIVYENPSYLMCILKSDITDKNDAYN